MQYAAYRANSRWQEGLDMRLMRFSQSCMGDLVGTPRSIFLCRASRGTAWPPHFLPAPLYRQKKICMHQLIQSVNAHMATDLTGIENVYSRAAKFFILLLLLLQA